MTKVKFVSRKPVKTSVTVYRSPCARPARNNAARRGARQMEWLTTTTRRLFDTTPCLNLTLDDQSDETLLVDENADTPARKRRRSKSARWPAPGDSAMVLRARPVNEADDNVYAPPVSVLNWGKRHLTEVEAAQFVRVALVVQDRKEMSMDDLCECWRLSRALGYNLLKKWKEDGHVDRASRSGRPKVITPRLGKILVNICDEKQGRLTFKELADKLNERAGTTICEQTVRNYCKKISGDEVATSTCRFSPTNTSQRARNGRRRIYTTLGVTSKLASAGSTSTRSSFTRARCM